MTATEFANPNPPPASPRPEPAPGPDPRRRSTFLAGLLSVLPGLGQVYLGYYRRGLTQFVIWIAILLALINEFGGDALLPAFGIGLVFAWTFAIVDAVRRASLFNLALAGVEQAPLPQDFAWPEGVGFGGSFFWGAILVVAGLVLFLHTRFEISMAWIEEWWPLGIVAAGAWLFGRAWIDRSARGGSPDAD